MDTVEAIIKALGGSGVVSEATGVSPNTVVYWTHRERIPSDYFNALIELAAKQNVGGIDFDVLLKACKARKKREPQAAA
jgi:hypothetical protein